MSFQDKTLTCSDCSAAFTFSAAEQEQFQSKGYANEPKRCPECRQARKERQAASAVSGNNAGNGNYNTLRRQMFPAVCSGCSKPTSVPFEPRQGRPVYCSDCFRKVKEPR